MNLAEDTIWLQMQETGSLEGRPVIKLETTESTNSEAMEHGKKGAAAGTVVVAESQTRGRGRLSRTWLSPKGTGLYFSLILRPKLDIENLPKITIAAGVAICKALEKETSVSPKIKWPNDIMVAGKKCGGILTEAEVLNASDSPLVILGAGVNISTPLADFPEYLKPKVTTLLEASGRLYLRGELLQVMLAEIESTLALLESGDFQTILAAWRERDAIGTAKLNWVTSNGKTVTGISQGIDHHGLLHIRDDHGRVHEVLSGDVNLAG